MWSLDRGWQTWKHQEKLSEKSWVTVLEEISTEVTMNTSLWGNDQVGKLKGQCVSKLDTHSHHSGSFSKFQSPGWTLIQDLQGFEVFFFIQKLLRWFSKAQPILFSSVGWLSHVQLFAAPWTAARQASLCITNSRSLFKLMSIESLMPSNHLILCCPLLFPPSIFPNIRIFSNDSVLRIRWPNYWSFSFRISPSNEYSGLISFRMGWLDLQPWESLILDTLSICK